jgi:YD repeat-containing protein
VLITEGDGSAVYFEKDGSSFDTPNGDFSTLSNYAGGFKRVYANGDEVIFDANGRMEEFRPLYGVPANTVSYYYGTGGELTHMDPYSSSSISTYLVHEGDSILVHEGEKNGLAPDIYRTTVLRLNGAGHVTSIEGPDGNDELSFGYTTGRITTVTDRRGETTDYEYDDLGYLFSVELPQIKVDGQNVRPTIEQQSLALTIGPDSTSGEGTSGNPATPVTTANVKPWVEDARGARTYFSLDPHGFRSAETIEEPLGRTTKVTRNNKTQVTRVDRPSGAYSTTSWSGPRMTGTFESTTGHTASYGYASPPESNFNQPIRAYDNKGNREIWYQYDGNDRLSAVRYDTIGGPLLASYTYRADGQPFSGTDSDTGHQVKYEYGTVFDYENLKAVHRIRGTDTLTTRYESDDYGRRVKTVNPAGDSSFVAYDDLDRLQWSVNALGDTTYFDYDSYLTTEIEDAKGQIHESAFNALGWATSSIDPNGDTTHVGYDENGNVISAVDRLGNEASFGYDSMNLPTFQEVEGETTYLWIDPEGLKSAAWNAVSADTTEYDTAGRPVKQIVRRGAGLSRRYVIESAFDDDGPRNRVWVSAPGSIDYDMRTVWNDEGRLERLSNHGPTTPVHTDFVYNDHHQLDEVKVGGSKRWEYDYSSFHPLGNVNYPVSALDDALGYGVNLDPDLLRISEWNWAGGDTVRTIDYDAAGQVTAIVDSAFISPTCEWLRQLR